LAHLLEQRPEPEQLQREGVAIGGLGPAAVAPSLQRVQRQLERNLTADKIGHLLEQRAPVSDLTRAGVLSQTGLPGVAPSLQGVQRHLERQLARSNLHHAMTNRPSLRELYERGIWREPQSPPSAKKQQQQRQRRNGTGAAAAAGSGHRGGSNSQASSPSYSQIWEEQQRREQLGQQAAQLQAAQMRAVYEYNQHQSNLMRMAEFQRLEQELQRQATIEQLRRLHQEQDAAAAAAAAAAAQHAALSSSSSSSSRSRLFSLTRLLLQVISSLSSAGVLSPRRKALLKDLTIQQDPRILQAAERFEYLGGRDSNALQQALITLSD